MITDLLKTLDRLGLKKTDALVFTTLLRQSDGLFAQDIARLTCIQRSTVDVVLERLIENGYVLQSRIGARTRYQAQAPDKIAYAKDSILEAFRDQIPFMQSLSGPVRMNELRFFEGSEGLEQFYDEALYVLGQLPASQREVLSISSGVAVMKLIPDLEQFWVRRRVDLGISVRVIAPLTSKRVQSYLTRPSQLRRVRYFDAKKYPFHAVFEVFGLDLVTLYAATHPLRGVVIKDAKLAASLRSFFCLVWDGLPSETV